MCLSPVSAILATNLVCKNKTHERNKMSLTLLRKASSVIIIIVVGILVYHRSGAELIECKFAEDTDICVFNHALIDYNHVYDFRPANMTSASNITKISFLQRVPLDMTDEIMHLLCDTFYNLHEIFVNGQTMHCDVYEYRMPQTQETSLLVEDVAGLHNEVLEEVVRKGTARGSDELHLKMDLVVASVGVLVVLCFALGTWLLIRYIRKKRRDRFWRRSRLYSSRYGHNI